MIAFIKRNKQKIRSYVFLLLVFVFYVFSIFYLFGSHDILASIVCVFCLYIFFHFLALDYRHLKEMYMLWLVFFLSLLNILLFFVLSWDINVWLMVSVFVFNFSLFALFYSLNTIEFNSVSYFLKWGYIFTLFITITYSLVLIWVFKQFPFTCEWLREMSNKLVEFVEEPFMMPARKIKEKVNSNKKEVFQTELVDEKVEDIVLWFKWVTVSADFGTFLYPMVDKINIWKEKNIDQIMSDQEFYSEWMCNMLLTEINEKYRLKELWVSAVVLTYLLLFGFVRIAFFIISFIWFLLFKLLYFVWIYKIEKVKKQVDEIK